jgi:hypothetical protein
MNNIGTKTVDIITFNPDMKMEPSDLRLYIQSPLSKVE